MRPVESRPNIVDVCDAYLDSSDNDATQSDKREGIENHTHARNAVSSVDSRPVAGGEAVAPAAAIG
jgi:hypothetical protein